MRRIDGVAIHRFDARACAQVARHAYLREYAQALSHESRGRFAASRRGRPFDVVHACNPPDLLLAAALPLNDTAVRRSCSITTTSFPSSISRASAGNRDSRLSRTSRRSSV